jgi:hypothetical protein
MPTGIYPRKPRTKNLHRGHVSFSVTADVWQRLQARATETGALSVASLVRRFVVSRLDEIAPTGDPT